MISLRSHKHHVYGESVRKIALSPLDTKRYILDDGIRTRAIGYGELTCIYYLKYKKLSEFLQLVFLLCDVCLV